MKNTSKIYVVLLTVSLSGTIGCTKNNDNNKNPTPKTYGLTTTYAGQLNYGSVNGIDTLASFAGPASVDVDANGNVYVADAGNELIRKITPNGEVSTIAGNGNIGADNGASTSASFHSPFGIAVDVSGNIYVADSGNNLVRKITASGTVTTLAGSGAKGHDNGTGTAATFDFPYGIAVDVAGNVYVADSNNHMIRKITPGGVVTTLAGDGTMGTKNGSGLLANFNYPQDLDVDASGNILVADQNNHLIRKITPSGEVSTIAGNGTKGSADGTALNASFNFPDSITHDAAGNIYVADEGSSLIRKITPSGTVSTLAGNGSFGFNNGIGTAASFNEIFGITIDKAQNLYVADFGNNMIRKVVVK